MELAGQQADVGHARFSARAHDASASDLPSFIGFCCFSAALQLYDNVALLENADLFNGVLYASLAQIVLFGIVAVAGLARDLRLPRALALASASVGAACMLVGVCPWGSALCVPSAVLGGASLAVLSVCWGARLATRPAETLCLRVVAGLFVGSAVASVLFAADIALLSEVAIAALLVGTGVSWLMPDDAAQPDGGSGASAAAQGGSAPVPGAAGRGRQLFGASAAVIVTLVVSCLLSAFFSGVTINPYGVQSKYIDAYMHLVTTLSFCLLALDCIVFKKVHLQGFVLAALAVLLLGLLMLSTGLAGSVVVPVGVILAMRGFSWGLGWVVLVAFVCTGRPRAAGVSALCLLASGSALGRGAGVLLNNSGVASFADLGTFGVACITLLAVAYALMNATKLSQINIPVGFDLGSRAQQGSGAVGGQEAGSPHADAVSGDSELADGGRVAPSKGPDSFRLAGLELTDKEQSVAELLLLGVTYQYIADNLGISTSTVKFHAKNIYLKAGVETKRDFLEKCSEPQDKAGDRACRG